MFIVNYDSSSYTRLKESLDSLKYNYEILRIKNEQLYRLDSLFQESVYKIKQKVICLDKKLSEYIDKKYNLLNFHIDNLLYYVNPLYVRTDSLENSEDCSDEYIFFFVKNKLTTECKTKEQGSLTYFSIVEETVIEFAEQQNKDVPFRNYSLTVSKDREQLFVKYIKPIFEQELYSADEQKLIIELNKLNKKR